MELDESTRTGRSSAQELASEIEARWEELQAPQD